MGDIVNLNQFRKDKARKVKTKTAQDNRVKHGRTKAEKIKDAAKKALEDTRLSNKEFDDKTED